MGLDPCDFWSGGRRDVGKGELDCPKAKLTLLWEVPEWGDVNCEIPRWFEGRTKHSLEWC